MRYYSYALISVIGNGIIFVITVINVAIFMLTVGMYVVRFDINAISVTMRVISVCVNVNNVPMFVISVLCF
jgi:hypothetical protein